MLWLMGEETRTQLTCGDLEPRFCDSTHCSQYQQRVCEHPEDAELPTATLCSLALSLHMQGGAGQAAENYSCKLQRGNVELEPRRHFPGITQSTLAAAKPRSNMPVTLPIDVCLSSPEDPSWGRSHFVLWQYVRAFVALSKMSCFRFPSCSSDTWMLSIIDLVNRFFHAKPF